MKNIAIAAALCAASLSTSACATRASGVAPVAVSATDFSGLSCADARTQLQLTRERVTALSKRQNNAALADTAGVFLALIPVGSVFGGGVEGELAQAKGEQIALERNVMQRCSS
ncbi:MAG: hypothetical protein EON91_02580 [Brevundimonas sp.]|uniref:hypothetical protein n=1 Tax=Brevundimonas sp. TaxID=1871086 RepID=UPI0011F5EB8B|nr:hypothetical protein [Brevundimonas sp.]RZJ19099.1 MAG: hypothetical protein EON91_02580 [Brevundimonas sp.]